MRVPTLKDAAAAAAVMRTTKLARVYKTGLFHAAIILNCNWIVLLISMKYNRFRNYICTSLYTQFVYLYVNISCFFLYYNKQSDAHR